MPPNDLWVGEYIEAWTVSAKDVVLKNNSTSGGFITALIKHLLDENIYDGAFLVDTYNYEKKVESAIYRKGDDLSQTPKSRYIPVMHTSCVQYILNNREEKLIIVAVPCFIEGLLTVISKYKLNRENYLILGLFCDKTMNYNIFPYFEHLITPKKPIRLYFRHKSKSGWPGDVMLECEGGNTINLPAYKRMQVKDYFIPERCLYCLDKLNQFSDISIGDNYTNKDMLSGGSNSIIIRTEKGKQAFDSAAQANLFEYYKSDIDDIKNSQHINERSKNLLFQQSKQSALLIKNTEFTVNVNVKDGYSEKLRKLSLGANCDFNAIDREVKEKRKANKNIWQRILEHLRSIKKKTG